MHYASFVFCWKEWTNPSSRKRLYYLFGLLILLQWLVFVLLVAAEMATQPRDLQSRNIILSDYYHNGSWAAGSCFSEACLQQQAQVLARTFPNRTDHQWCIASGRKKDTNGKWQGLILVKGKYLMLEHGKSLYREMNLTNLVVFLYCSVPKAASSTSAGVTIRISRNSQQRSRSNKKSCKSMQWRHHLAQNYANRSRTKAYIWTTVRDPAERALSSIFFHNISLRSLQQQNNVSDHDLLEQLQYSTKDHMGASSLGQGGFQLRYTAFREIAPYSFWNASRPRRVRHPTALQNLVRETLSRYDFVAVTERMDESLVALALLLDVPVTDVLVSSAKVSGQSHFRFVHTAGHKFSCLPTVRPYKSPRVKRFLASDAWKAANWGDYLLHEAASQSLDRTIEALGYERFGEALKEYRKWQERESQHCASTAQYPCSDTGVPQPKVSEKSCYVPFADFGCGYKCLDEMVAAPSLESDLDKDTMETDID